MYFYEEGVHFVIIVRIFATETGIDIYINFIL